MAGTAMTAASAAVTSDSRIFIDGLPSDVLTVRVSGDPRAPVDVAVSRREDRPAITKGDAGAAQASQSGPTTIRNTPMLRSAGAATGVWNPRGGQRALWRQFAVPARCYRK